MNQKPFSFGIGLLFTIIIILISQISGLLFLLFGLNTLNQFGFSLTISAFLSSILGLLIIYFFVWISKYPLKEYLSLTKFKLKDMIKWFLIFAIFIGLSEFILYKYKIYTYPDFLKKAYFSTNFPILLFFVIIFIYPSFEEALFRGFLFKSIENSKLGGVSAVFITSFFWSILHIQYNFYVILVIFFGGIILGLSRLKTSSLYVPLILHILQNLSSSIFFYYTIK